MTTVPSVPTVTAPPSEERVTRTGSPVAAAWIRLRRVARARAGLTSTVIAAPPSPSSTATSSQAAASSRVTS